MKKILPTLVLCFTLLNAWSQNEDSVFIRRISDEILLHGKAYDDLRTLTKKIGGRLSGSPQMVKAEQWGAQTLKNAKADTIWLQECMVPHWVRGGKDMAIEHYDAFTGNIRKTTPVVKNIDVI